MGALQKALAQILARLRDMTLSQKIALFLGGALVAVSMMSLVQWAASPEMVPLLPQDLSMEELAPLREGLETMGEDYEIEGNRIMVRSGANRQAILARLQQDDKLPANTSIAFAGLIEQSNPWLSQAENSRRWVVALQSELEAVLAQFNGVRAARVFLPLETARKRFARMDPPKSASVTLIMDSGDRVPRTLAKAAARLVSGAVEGLPINNVQVVDASGVPAIDWDLERDATSKLSRLLIQAESRYRESIRNLLSADPKALISVQAELNTTTSSKRVDQPINPVMVSEETESETTNRVNRREAPGVQPNTEMAAGRGGTDESHERSRSKIENQPGMERVVQDTPAGDVKQVTAAIRLSYSYLESLYRRANPDAEQVTEEQIDAVFERERARLLPQLALLVRPQDATNVALSYYYDGMLNEVAAGQTGTIGEALDLMNTYGPESGLALLALMSLGMMLHLAKRSDDGESFGLELGLPEEAIEAAQMAASDIGMMSHAMQAAGARGGGGGGMMGGVGGGPPMVGADGQVMDVDGSGDAPQVAATEGVLVAQEVDANTVQIRKMIDQIVEMSESDPDVVAALVEQWIQRNEQYHDGIS